MEHSIGLTLLNVGDVGNKPGATLWCHKQREIHLNRILDWEVAPSLQLISYFSLLVYWDCHCKLL